MKTTLNVLIVALTFLTASLASAEGFGSILPNPRPPIIDPPAFIIPSPRPPIIDPPQFVQLEVVQYGYLFNVTVPVDATDAQIQEQIDLQIREI